MIIAAITRPTGQLVISTEPHPKTGAAMVVIAHVRNDDSVAHKTALQPSEIAQVVAALQLAAQKLTARKPQHRTISGADLEAETRRLF